MEKSIKQYDRECMKMAIMKHEETFRHQVRELHRLYRVQKLLMNDMKIAAADAKSKSYREKRRPRRPLDLELPAEEFIGEAEAEVDEESELELTLAIGDKGRRRKKKDASFTSDSGGSFSSNSAESAANPTVGNDWRLYRDAADANPIGFQMRQERVIHPPWLLQCLSLNIS